MQHSTRVRLLLGVAALLAVVAMAIGAAACGSSSSSSSSASATPAGTPSPTLTPVQMQSGTNVGAGATFPAPIYLKWGDAYNTAKGVKLNYQPIGSGGGIAAIEAKLVNFGASDAPLQEADLTANGLAQFPMIVGGDVVVVHLNGVADGQLSRGVRKCVQCQRTVPAKQNKCMYCGTVQPISSVFEGI